MSDALDPSLVCNDEDCSRVAVHRKHLVVRRPPPRVHHRPSKKPVWQLDDPEGLLQSVLRATMTTAKPYVISEIVREVRDDYGSVSERTVYRKVRELVERGRLIKLDLGFTFAAYIVPGARLLSDPAAMREIILGEHEFGRSCTGKARYA